MKLSGGSNISSSSQIGDGVIIDADVNASADIAGSKLQALLVGTNAGVIPSTGVANAHIAAGAAIAGSKLQALLVGTNAGVIPSTGVANAHIAAGAAIALSKLASDPLARANHTGTQTASTISDFDAAAVAAVGNPWTTVKKTADETRQSTTTNTADSELAFAVAANTRYTVRLRVLFNSANAAADFKCVLTGPASPTGIQGHSLASAANDNSSAIGASFVIESFNTLAGSSISAVNTDTGYGFVEMDFVFLNGANAGTLAFAWAQVASIASDTTVCKGSYLEYYSS